MLFYPDVMVSCHQEDRQAEQFLSHPALIVEVLSGSIAAFDRRDKFAAYRSLVSLHDYSGDDKCELLGLEVEISLSEIFEDIEITQS